VKVSEEFILKRVRALNRLEKDFIKFTYESKKPEDDAELEAWFRKAVAMSAKAFDLKNEILTELHDTASLSIYDSEVLRTLDIIRRNEKMYSISFYENFAKFVNEKFENWQDKLDLTLTDYLCSSGKDLSEEFHSSFDLYGYYEAKAKVGPIISSLQVPPAILSYFEEIKNVFAFGQYRSCIALCRALLEMSLWDRLSRKKVFTDTDSKVTSIDVAKEDNLYKYINLAKYNNILDGSGVNTANNIRKTSNGILHIRSRVVKIDEKDALKIIFSTVQIVEELYRDQFK
jgi:hypothetical protein